MEHTSEKKWVVTHKGADFQGIAKAFDISPIIARIIRNRDVISLPEIDQYLYGTIGDLYDGMLLKDMDKAIQILAEKIQDKVAIRVIGDYDIDGVTATYILQEGLENLGAHVDTDIPERIRDGFGLNKLLIDRALEDGVDTIITCDNGIAAREEIRYGKSKGLTIIVTDHHEVPYKEGAAGREYLLPPADAIINPHRPGCDYPFKGLCGAAVAYKLIEALYEVLDRDADDMDYLLELVAIATVGDVMDLVDENRIFVKQGLEMLKRTQNKGLKALIECTNTNPDKISAYHIGYVLGPCINAGGRLDTAKRALDLLSSTSVKEALLLAEELKALNDSRKDLTAQGVEEAIQQIEETSLGQDKVLVVYLPDCHESIAGIIAGRIRERYYRPVFVLTKAEEGVKGSGRSIEGYSMFEELSKCGELFTRFGGHKMAAGLSLKEEQVDTFRKRINEYTTLKDEDLVEKIAIDMQLPLKYVTKELIKQLELLEPFGKGNSKPVFAEKELAVRNVSIVGKHQNVLKFQVRDKTGVSLEGIYFGEAQKAFDYFQKHPRLSFTYYPTINEYMGHETVQVVVLNYQ